jgi:hypothetical protein
MLDPRLALGSPKDFQIPQCVETADEAFASSAICRQWQAKA